MSTQTMELNNEAVVQSNGENGLADILEFDYANSGEKLDSVRESLLAMDSQTGKFNLNVPLTVSSAMRVYKSFDTDRTLFEADFT